MIDQKWLKNLIQTASHDTIVVIPLKDMELYFGEHNYNITNDTIFSKDQVRYRYPRRVEIFAGEDIKNYNIDISRKGVVYYIAKQFVNHFVYKSTITIIDDEEVLY